MTGWPSSVVRSVIACWISAVVCAVAASSPTTRSWSRYIAEHHLASGDPGHGTAHLHQALKIYQRLGMIRDTRRVQNRLNSLAAYANGGTAVVTSLSAYQMGSISP